MLIGEYYHSIDAKGRLIMPVRFRDDLGDNFVVSKGLDNCLYAYSIPEWERFERLISSQKSAESRMLQRFFFSGATECETDSQGRIVIPQPFREFAGLKKDVVVLGVHNRAEIWDKEKWSGYMQNDAFSADAIADAMEKLGL